MQLTNSNGEHITDLSKSEKCKFFNETFSMDTVSLIKERMGYVESVKNCHECAYFVQSENICNISNMANIPVKPGGTCAYHVRNKKLPPDPNEIIYQYKILGDVNNEWIDCNKEWYDGADSVPNIKVQIKR